MAQIRRLTRKEKIKLAKTDPKEVATSIGIDLKKYTVTGRLRRDPEIQQIRTRLAERALK